MPLTHLPTGKLQIPPEVILKSPTRICSGKLHHSPRTTFTTATSSELPKGIRIPRHNYGSIETYKGTTSYCFLHPQ
jgi:hypothetical protein